MYWLYTDISYTSTRSESTFDMNKAKCLIYQTCFPSFSPNICVCTSLHWQCRIPYKQSASVAFRKLTKLSTDLSGSYLRLWHRLIQYNQLYIWLLYVQSSAVLCTIKHYSFGVIGNKDIWSFISEKIIFSYFLLMTYCENFVSFFLSGFLYCCGVMLW